MKINELSANPRERYIFIFLSFTVLAWIVFKPSQIIETNLYFPVYVFSFISAIWFFLNVYIEDKSYSKPLFFACFLLTSISIFSINLSSDIDRRIITNWPAWFCIFSLGYFLAKKTDGYVSFLPKFAKIFLVAQTIIALIQLLEPNSFDVFWPSDKTRGLDSIVRVTGSMYNPNFFAAVVTLLIAFIVAGKEPLKEWVWVVLGCVLILLSGSRTFIIGYPLVISTLYFLISEGKAKYTKTVFSLIILYALTFFVLFVFKDTLVYSSRILSVFLENSNVNDLENIISLSGRVGLWESVIFQLNSGSFYNYIFGSHNAVLNPHNSYLYVLYKYGFIGLILVGYLFFVCFKVSFYAKDTYEGRLLFMVTLTIMGFGLADISSVTMTFGIYLALVLGVALYRLHELHEAG